MPTALLALLLARVALGAPDAAHAVPAATSGAADPADPADPAAPTLPPAPDPADPRAEAHAAFLAGRTAFEAGAWARALTELARARVGLDPTADAPLLAATGWLEAQACLALGAPFPAWLHLRDLDAAAFSVPDGDLLLQLHRGLLLARAERWEPAAAMLLLPGLLLDAPDDRVRALRASAQSLHHLRRPAEALFAATSALDLVDAAADPLLAASVRRDLATLHASTGDFASAVAVLEPGLALATAARSAEWEAALALDLGDAQAAQGAAAPARAAYLRARTVATLGDVPGDRARAQAGLAQVQARARSLAAPLAFARAARWARADPAAAAEVSERRAVVAEEARRPRAYVRWMRDAAAHRAEAGRDGQAQTCLAGALLAALSLGAPAVDRVLADVHGAEVDFLVAVARDLTAAALAAPATPTAGPSAADVYRLLARRADGLPARDAPRAHALAAAGLRRIASPDVLAPDAGLAVVAVASDSPAATLGLVPGDVLVAYGGTPFVRARDLPAALYAQGVGGHLVVLGAEGRREVAVPTVALGVDVQPF